MRFPLLVLAAVVSLFLVAAPAQAAFTGDVTGSEVRITSDDANDLLQIADQNGFLTHSAAGAGYSSQYDWNSAPAINQNVPDAAQVKVVVTGGGGDDLLRVGDDTYAADTVQFPIIFRGGDGTDSLIVDASAHTANRTLDVGGDAAGAGFVFDGVVGSFRAEGVENLPVQLGSGNDTVRVSGTSHAVPVLVDGGPGSDKALVGSPGNGLAALHGEFAFTGGTGDDSLAVDDAASTGGSVIDIDDAGLRKGTGIARPGFGVEHASLTAGSGGDSIAKSSGLAWSLNAAGGDDVVSVRDAVGDTVACGAGADFVVSDSLDSLGADCERSDRAAAGSGSGGTSGSSGTGTAPADASGGSGSGGPGPADAKAPVVTLKGLPSKSVRRKSLLRGLKPKLSADEPASFEVTLLGSAKRVSLARAYDLTLARKVLPLGAGARSVKLKPRKRTLGRTRKFTVRVVVSATDAAGNRSVITKTLRVRP